MPVLEENLVAFCVAKGLTSGGIQSSRPSFLLLKQYCLSFSYLKVSHPIFIFFTQLHLCPMQSAHKLSISIQCSPFTAGKGSLGGLPQVSNHSLLFMLSSKELLEPKLYVSLVWNKASQRWPCGSIESSEYSGCRLHEARGLLFLLDFFPHPAVHLSVGFGMEMTKSTLHIFNQCLYFLKVELGYLSQSI